MRDKLKDLSKEYDKSENDLKALQSVGQVIIQDLYCVVQNFCGSLFLQIGDFCVLQELILRLGQIGFSCWELILVIFRKSVTNH